MSRRTTQYPAFKPKPFAGAERTSELYGTARWKRERAEFLALNPLCRACMNEQRVIAATIVDHDQPHRGDEAAFWDQRTWQPLCKRHHDAKTGRESRERIAPRNRPAEAHPGSVKS